MLRVERISHWRSTTNEFTRYGDAVASAIRHENRPCGRRIKIIMRSIRFTARYPKLMRASDLGESTPFEGKPAGRGADIRLEESQSLEVQPKSLYVVNLNVQDGRGEQQQASECRSFRVRLASLRKSRELSSTSLRLKL